MSENKGNKRPRTSDGEEEPAHKKSKCCENCLDGGEGDEYVRCKHCDNFLCEECDAMGADWVSFAGEWFCSTCIQTALEMHKLLPSVSAIINRTDDVIDMTTMLLRAQDFKKLFKDLLHFVRTDSPVDEQGHKLLAMMLEQTLDGYSRTCYREKMKNALLARKHVYPQLAEKYDN